ncbi:hypothetical protein ACQ4PT_058504 [Festuca glaucescens]
MGRRREQLRRVRLTRARLLPQRHFSRFREIAFDHAILHKGDGTHLFPLLFSYESFGHSVEQLYTRERTKLLPSSLMTATVRKVFDEMGCARIAVCNAMLHVCAKARDATRAQPLMMRMDAAGVPLDRFSFGIVRDLR